MRTRSLFLIATIMLVSATAACEQPSEPVPASRSSPSEKPLPTGVSGATEPTESTAPTETGGPTGPTGRDGSPVDAPAAVMATRDAILKGAKTHDFEALEALIDPNRFEYNFDDGSYAVPFWREDPTPLDMLATILRMPFTTDAEAYRGGRGSPKLYIWPSLMGSDLKDVTAKEQAMLEDLGISQEEARSMIEFGGYIGPRAGIAKDGTWVWYVVGGD